MALITFKNISEILILLLRLITFSLLCVLLALNVSTSALLLCNIQQMLTDDKFGEGLNFVEGHSRKPIFFLLSTDI